MFVELTVENVAIIERSQLQPGPGLTVLTGETGAGKSILVDAIELAIGQRADSDLVRAGAGRAVVSLAVDVSGKLRGICESLGVFAEDGLLLIQREVFAEGRSQARIGGKLAPISTLRALGQAMVDLHGQHDHQSLMIADRHIEFLDSWIGVPAEPLKATIGGHFRQVQLLRSQLAALQRNQRDTAQRTDMLRFQVEEIETVAPGVGEFDELSAQLARLMNADRLQSFAQDVLTRLADQEPSAQDHLSISVKSLEEGAKLDPSMDAPLVPLRESYYQLLEAIQELRSYSESLESDPGALEATAARIDSLKGLRRKYGDDEAAILSFLEKAKSELETLENPDLNQEELAYQLGESEKQLSEAAGKLTDVRRATSLDFASLIETHLHDLAMDKAVFRVEIKAKAIDESGGDDVQFYFSANAGEPPRPLSKIASGGEISRVMLAIKAAMASEVQVPTLIFDEVDSGLSGRAAAAVAKKLSELAKHCQVLAITHLPQIASVAGTHYRIEKHEQTGRSTTDVRLLSPEERVEEIARMVGGETVSETAREHARDLLRRP